MTNQEKDQLLKIAAGWIGYLEKSTKNYAVYDSNTNGAGKGNFTRFGRIADIVLYGIDKRVKDGYPWCAMFILSCLYEMKAGRQNTTVPDGQMPIDAEARKWICDNLNAGKPIPYHAGCQAWWTAYKQRGKVGNTPHAGDFVVYYDQTNHPYHIGIVESVSGNTFTTIEGNTSATGTNIDPNGGAVARKQRKNNHCIFLYN